MTSASSLRFARAQRVRVVVEEAEVVGTELAHARDRGFEDFDRGVGVVAFGEHRAEELRCARFGVVLREHLAAKTFGLGEVAATMGRDGPAEELVYRDAQRLAPFSSTHERVLECRRISDLIGNRPWFGQCYEASLWRRGG